MEILQERQGAATHKLFKDLFGIWKNFGKLLKGELKRTIINANTLLQIMVGPTLAGADYAKVMQKNKAKIAKIDADAEKILDQLPVGPAASSVLWAIAPGPMLFNSVRETSKKVTPDTVDSFMDEYGFKDLYLGRIPVGKMFTSVAKKGAQAGGFATLNRQAFEKGEKDLDKAAKDKWYTPIERIFQLQNPFKPGPGARDESFRNSGELLLEADKPSPEEQVFLNYLKMEGFETQYMQEVGIPYVEAKDELITGLVDVFEKEIEEVAVIATAVTLEDFQKAIQASTVEKLKPLKGQNFVDQMSKEVDGLIEDKKLLKKFLKVLKKDISEFDGKEQELKKLLTQKIYEKEFSELRMQAIESIEDAVEEIKIEILGDMEEKDLKSLRINPLGEQLYSSITSGLQRLDKATTSIATLSQEAQKVGS